MRTYDLEALARELFERHAKRIQREASWDELSDYLRGYYRANIRETIECYERQLDELEKQAKREARKGNRK